MRPVDFYQLMIAVNLRIVRRRIEGMRHQSRLMLAVLSTFVVGYWVAGYVLFREGFDFLGKFPGMGNMLVDRMLYMFFAFLFVMLAFSNMVIGYSAIFKGQETQWMLTLPVRHTDVFRCKLIETALLSSWAFLFLSAPMLLAYGQSQQVNVLFYVKAFLLFIPFIVIPASLGLLVILLAVRFMQRRLFQWTLAVSGVLAIVAGLILMQPSDINQVSQIQSYGVVQKLLENSRLAVQPFWPSAWVTRGVIAWGEGQESQGMFYFGLLVSNALMAGMVCFMVSRKSFYEGWSRNHSQSAATVGKSWFDNPIIVKEPGRLTRFLAMIPFISPPMRSLIVKDVKVFWRDTSQWSQAVIFFGLLGLYVLNLRTVSYRAESEFWGHFLAFLTLGTSTMTLSTLTTRFVYPQLSLEGKRLWMVGMMPDGLRLVLMEKFWLSSIASMLVTTALTLVSCFTLRLPGHLTLVFVTTIILMSFSLCSVAVSIGALFPNFGTGSTANRFDDNPARIVSGFGGTLCFVVSLVYIVLMIGAQSMPLIATGTSGAFPLQHPSATTLLAWILSITLSLVTIVVPMRLAMRHVRSLEF
jgi:ABC-2 type transport system permease protein